MSVPGADGRREPLPEEKKKKRNEQVLREVRGGPLYDRVALRDSAKQAGGHRPLGGEISTILVSYPGRAGASLGPITFQG